MKAWYIVLYWLPFRCVEFFFPGGIVSWVIIICLPQCNCFVDHHNLFCPFDDWYQHLSVLCPTLTLSYSLQLFPLSWRHLSLNVNLLQLPSVSHTPCVSVSLLYVLPTSICSQLPSIQIFFPFQLLILSYPISVYDYEFA